METSSEITAIFNSTVTLSCELYGYLPIGAQPSISWSKVGRDSIFGSTAVTVEGSRQIQNGGSSPRPSLVSNLTIDVVDASVAGLYICSSQGTVGTITLRVEGTQCGGYYIILSELLLQTYYY